MEKGKNPNLSATQKLLEQLRFDNKPVRIPPLKPSGLVISTTYSVAIGCWNTVNPPKEMIAETRKKGNDFRIY